jgi:hypothetical protein
MSTVDLRMVQVLMGHEDIQMTCRCAHLAPRYELAALEKLAGFSDAPHTERPTDTTTNTGTSESIEKVLAEVT